MILRLATPFDGPALAAIYRPSVVERVTSFELDPPDGAEMARRVERCVERTPWLVAERDAVVVGYAYAGLHRERPAYQWSVETSAYVRDDAHRTGVARALYASLFAILALQGFRNAYAGITLPNAASEGFHESFGFTRVGVYHGVGYKFGAWHDVLWLERAILPQVAEPPAPLALPVLRSDPSGAAAVERALSGG
ncbi:MAG: N-acetyltransferase [Gemmatimonadaceae bacterium]|nr:N-acetyltransferase [Gemmatimonadaceae bacterium]NUQ93998.1 N-acetyltransferase [Gemmatimonadaceae bacterium]NUR17982.1 N-acetyltransferase [Gemmatimonadaceae bacterium]